MSVEVYHLIWSIIGSVFLGAIAGIVLKPIFQAYAVQWPAQYSDVSNVVDSSSSRNLGVYFIFRFVPVLLTSALVVGISEAFKLETVWAVTALVGVHLLMTTLSRGIWKDIKNQNPGIKVRRILVHVISALMVAFAAFVPFLLRKYHDVWVPSPDQLKEAFWGSLIIGLIFLLYRNLTKFVENEAVSELSNNLSRISEENMEAIRHWSSEFSVSPRFITSIVATESINRPKTLRVLERVTGTIFGSGSYGIAQVQSKVPIGDVESIRLLCEKYSGFNPSTLGDDLKDLNLRIKFAQHNVGTKFVNLAMSIYQSFRDGSWISSKESDYENDLPVIIHESGEVVDSGLRLIFSVSSDVSQIEVKQESHAVPFVFEGKKFLDRRKYLVDLAYPIVSPLSIRCHSDSNQKKVSLDLQNEWEFLN